MGRVYISTRPQPTECGQVFGVNRRVCRRPAGHRGRHSVVSDLRTLWESRR